MTAKGGKIETEQLIEETRRMLKNTRAFLARIREGEEATGRYIEQLKETLENDLRRLERKLEPPGAEELDEPRPEKE